MKIPVDHTKLIDSPYNVKNNDLFMFSTSDMKDIIQDIINGNPTCYLISGYRGSGKSSFIKKLETEVKLKNSKAIFTTLNFAKYEVHSIVLRKLIRAFYLSSDSNGVLSELKTSHKNHVIQFQDLYERTFYDVAKNTNEKISDKKISSFSFKANLKDLVFVLAILFSSVSLLIGLDISNWYSWFISPLPLFGLWQFFSFQSKKIKEEVNSSETNKCMLYDDEIAEHHLIQVLERFNDEIKPIFILDELDKIQDADLAEKLINELKPLMLSGLASFIVVGGQNFYYNYYNSQTKDDGILSSLFSKVEHVSLFTNSGLRILFNNLIIINEKEITNDQRVLLESFIDYLIFESKKIPRRFNILIRQHIIWEENQAFLIIKNSLEKLSLYSLILMRVESIEESINDSENYNPAIKDYFSMQLLLIAHDILKSQNLFFTDYEIFDSIQYDKSNEITKEKLKPFLKSYINLFLDGLIEDKIIHKIKNPKGNEEKAFKLVREINKIVIKDDIQQEDSKLITNFYNFKNIVYEVYSQLNYEDSQDCKILPVSQLIDKFEDLKVFHTSKATKSRLKDIIDKGERLLTDELIEKDAIKLFKEHNINFNITINKLLEFFVFEKAKQFFKNYSFTRQLKINTQGNNRAFDLVGKNETESDLIFDIKYKNQGTYNLRDTLFQSYDYLGQYNNASKKKNLYITLAFSDENSETFEKNEYLFIKNLEETFNNYRNQIIFIPVCTYRLDLINDAFKKIENLKTEAQINLFKFSLEPIIITNKKDEFIPADFIKSQEGTFSVWVNLESSEHYFNKLMNNEYVISHATNNYSARKEGYQNVFALSLTPNKFNTNNDKPTSIRWRFWISNKNRENLKLKGPEIIKENNKWYNIIVRWDHKKPIVEFIINGAVMDRSVNYKEFWPEEILENAFIGTWGNKATIHYINRPIYRVISSPRFLDDNWVKAELANEPS